MRHSLLNNTSNKADIVSLLSTQKMEDNNATKNTVVDLPFEKWMMFQIVKYLLLYLV